MGQQRGLCHQPRDARADVGELPAVGGHISLPLGERAGGIRRQSHRPEAVESLIPSAARLGEGVAGVFVRTPRGVGDRAQLPALGMSPLGLATGRGVERRLQRRPVVDAAGDLSDPVGIGGERRQMRPPAVGPRGELIAGPDDGGATEPEPARPLPEGVGGGVCRAALGGPLGEQHAAPPLGFGGDDRPADLGLRFSGDPEAASCEA